MESGVLVPRRLESRTQAVEPRVGAQLAPREQWARAQSAQSPQPVAALRARPARVHDSQRLAPAQREAPEAVRSPEPSRR